MDKLTAMIEHQGRIIEMQGKIIERLVAMDERLKKVEEVSHKQITDDDIRKRAKDLWPHIFAPLTAICAVDPTKQTFCAPRHGRHDGRLC